MPKTKKNVKKIAKYFEASSAWLEACRRNGEIRLSESWPGTAREHAVIADLVRVDLTDPESWVARVEAVDPRHAAIAVGDWAVSQGVGSRVIFVRFC